jgi:hypothetical protein
MRLDEAVFVLARPKVPSMPTRRAFVIAGCTFAAGMLVGGACGYSAGVAAGAETPPGEPSAVELPKSGDAELDALRALAVQAPIEELLANWMLFMTVMANSYRGDPVLWQGIDRMCAAVTSGTVADGRRIASGLRGMIERGDAKLAASRSHWLPRLAEVR